MMLTATGLPPNMPMNVFRDILYQRCNIQRVILEQGTLGCGERSVHIACASAEQANTIIGTMDGATLGSYRINIERAVHPEMHGKGNQNQKPFYMMPDQKPLGVQPWSQPTNTLDAPMFSRRNDVAFLNAPVVPPSLYSQPPALRQSGDAGRFEPSQAKNFSQRNKPSRWQGQNQEASVPPSLLSTTYPLPSRVEIQQQSLLDKQMEALNTMKTWNPSAADQKWQQLSLIDQQIEALQALKREASKNYGLDEGSGPYHSRSPVARDSLAGDSWNRGRHGVGSPAGTAHESGGRNGPGPNNAPRPNRGPNYPSGPQRGRNDPGSNRGLGHNRGASAPTGGSRPDRGPSPNRGRGFDRSLNRGSVREQRPDLSLGPVKRRRSRSPRSNSSRRVDPWQRESRPDIPSLLDQKPSIPFCMKPGQNPPFAPLGVKGRFGSRPSFQNQPRQPLARQSRPGQSQRSNQAQSKRPNAPSSNPKRPNAPSSNPKKPNAKERPYQIPPKANIRPRQPPEVPEELKIAPKRDQEGIKAMSIAQQGMIHNIPTQVIREIFYSRPLYKAGVRNCYKRFLSHLKGIMEKRVTEIVKECNPVTQRVCMDIYRKRYPSKTDKPLFAQLLAIYAKEDAFAVEKLLVDTPWTSPAPVEQDNFSRRNMCQQRTELMLAANYICQVVLKPKAVGMIFNSYANQHIYDHFRLEVYNGLIDIAREMLSDWTIGKPVIVTAEKLCQEYSKKHTDEDHEALLKKTIEEYDKFNPAAPYATTFLGDDSDEEDEANVEGKTKVNGKADANDKADTDKNQTETDDKIDAENGKTDAEGKIDTDTVKIDTHVVKIDTDVVENDTDAVKIDTDAVKNEEQSKTDANDKADTEDNTAEGENSENEDEKPGVLSSRSRANRRNNALHVGAYIACNIVSGATLACEQPADASKHRASVMKSLTADDERLYQHIRRPVGLRMLSIMYNTGLVFMSTKPERFTASYRTEYGPESDHELIQESIGRIDAASEAKYKGKYSELEIVLPTTAAIIARNAIDNTAMVPNNIKSEDMKIYPTLKQRVEERIRDIVEEKKKLDPECTFTCEGLKRLYWEKYPKEETASLIRQLIEEYNEKNKETPYYGLWFLRENVTPPSYWCEVNVSPELRIELAAHRIVSHTLNASDKSAREYPVVEFVRSRVRKLVRKRLNKLDVGNITVDEMFDKYVKSNKYSDGQTLVLSVIQEVNAGKGKASKPIKIHSLAEHMKKETTFIPPKELIKQTIKVLIKVLLKPNPDTPSNMADAILRTRFTAKLQRRLTSMCGQSERAPNPTLFAEQYHKLFPKETDLELLKQMREDIEKKYENRINTKKEQRVEKKSQKTSDGPAASETAAVKKEPECEEINEQMMQEIDNLTAEMSAEKKEKDEDRVKKERDEEEIEDCMETNDVSLEDLDNINMNDLEDY